MPTLKFDSTTIAYDVQGEGYPVLMLAPGGMRSDRTQWARAPWKPQEQVVDQYQLVAMDQRNAGESRAPISAQDTWAAYTEDQIRLLDHLGIDKCHLIGMCIGGPFILGLLKAAPDRIAASVMMQPVGVDGNRQLLMDLYDKWGAELQETRADVQYSDLEGMKLNLWGSEGPMTATDDEMARMMNPVMILMGDDQFHTKRISHQINGALPNSTMIEDWKGDDRFADVDAAIQNFLAEHTPALQS